MNNNDGEYPPIQFYERREKSMDALTNDVGEFLREWDRTKPKRPTKRSRHDAADDLVAMFLEWMFEEMKIEGCPQAQEDTSHLGCPAYPNCEDWPGGCYEATGACAVTDGPSPQAVHEGVHRPTPDSVK
jgi:hypothetical protein